jgi:hypothetical protein
VDELRQRPDESLEEYLTRLEKLSTQVRDALAEARDRRVREQGQKTRLIRRPRPSESD